MRIWLAAVLLLACDSGDGPVTFVAGDGGVGIPRIGLVSFEVTTACATPVVFPGENAPVTVRSPARAGSEVLARVVDGPARLIEAEDDDVASRPIISGTARFNLTCTGFGTVRLFARDGGGRTATSDPVLCARPSGYDRACRSQQPPRPLGDWRVEQFEPTGELNRRLAPRGQAFGPLADQKPLKLRLVFEGGSRPATRGEVSVEVLPGGPDGVAVEPPTQATDQGTGEAVFNLAAGEASGEFQLHYTARLDGEVRELTSRPFVVTAPPAVGAEVSCTRGERPVPAFDANGGLVGAQVGVDCTLKARSVEGPPAEGTRFWVLTEAGQAAPPRGRLGPEGQVDFTVVVGGRPPVDVAPTGPSPLDGLVTVVGVVEGAELRDFDVPEPFVDTNDDGVRGADERFLDTNGDGMWTGPNGEVDDIALHWASTRLRWVGPVADVPETLRLDCEPPGCSPTPVPGVHDCPDGADAYLLPGAVVPGTARPADRNGQCTTEGGAATLFVTPPEAATIEDAVDVPLGPCSPAGLAPTPFTLRLKRAPPGPFTLGLGLPDGALVERTLCAP